MAVNAVHVLQNNAHDSRLPRQLTAALLGASLTDSFAGGLVLSKGHGVAGALDYVVTQNGAPNMSVNVAGGFAFVRGQFSTFNQGVYGVPNDGVVNLAISAAHGSLARRDLVILQVRDDAHGGGGGFNDSRLVVVTGTPAASPADPSLAAFPNNLILARVTVPAAAASIVTANITDLRERVMPETESGTWTPVSSGGSSFGVAGMTSTGRYTWSGGPASGDAGILAMQGLIQLGSAFSIGASIGVAIPTGFAMRFLGGQDHEVGRCTMRGVAVGNGPIWATSTVSLRFLATLVSGTYAVPAGTGAAIPFAWAVGDTIIWNASVQATRT